MACPTLETRTSGNASKSGEVKKFGPRDIWQGLSKKVNVLGMLAACKLDPFLCITHDGLKVLKNKDMDNPTRRQARPCPTGAITSGCTIAI